MALTNAQRQRRYRERRKAPQPQQHYRPPQDRRSRAQRWQDAVHTLLDLQHEYQAWLDNLPDSLGESAIPAGLESPQRPPVRPTWTVNRLRQRQLPANDGPGEGRAPGAAP